MGLISEQDRRPRDWGYRVAFDRKDLPSLQEMADHIRETHDIDMIESFNARCEQKLNSNTQRAELDNGIEIQQVTKTEDLVVNVGLQQCINIILGISSNRWANFGFTRNNGTIPPNVGQTALDNSVDGPNFLSMATYGWQEAKGMKLFFGTITPQDSALAFDMPRVDEMGISTPAGTILNRELFFNNPITRSQTGLMFRSVFMFSCVIEFCPVA